MNITRIAAEEIAIKLTAQKERDIKDMKGKLSMAVTLAYQSTIPKEVLESFEKHESWMSKTTYVRLVGHGFNYETINLTKTMPTKDRDYGNNFQVEKANSDNWIRQHRAIEAATKERKELIREIENALISLKTHKRIEEAFPEAAKFLPVKSNTAIAVNLTHIRTKLTP